MKFVLEQGYSCVGMRLHVSCLFLSLHWQLVKDVRRLVDNGEFLANRHSNSPVCKLIVTLLLELITDHSREVMCLLCVLFVCLFVCLFTSLLSSVTIIVCLVLR